MSASNAELTALLAGALTDPAQLRALVGSGGAIDSEANRQRVQVERVRRFAGFITKVQHNYLWEHFPSTIAATRAAGVELELFTDYFLSGVDRSAARARPLGEKLIAVTTFMSAYFRRSPRLRPIDAILSHERSMLDVAARLKDAAQSSDPCGGAPRSYAATGPIRVAWYRRDPFSASERGVRGTDWGPARSCWILYWGDVETRAVRTMEVDRLTARVLRFFAERQLRPAPTAEFMPRGIPRSQLRTRLAGLVRCGVLQRST